VSYRKTVILVTVTAFALSIFGFRYVQNSSFRRRTARARPRSVAAAGASFQATETQVKRMEEKLDGDESVVNYVAYVAAAARASTFRSTRSSVTELRAARDRH